MDGREVCRALRRDSDVPIIMLTALDEESDLVAGLELGADDYVTKPFSPRALVARVRAALRRARGQVRPPTVLRASGLEIDTAAHSATLDGAPIHLTPNEFKLLAALARHPGQTLTREQLLDELHTADLPGIDRSVDSHIKNLRHKLEADPSRPRFIETVYGVGYRFLGGD
jgi:two-component system alkaline phosphatase synthesis response regulator PhoP